jgi:hypothetical protein
MSFRIRGLSPEPFAHLYRQPDAVLAAHGAERRVADAKPGYPDRIELRDAEPGETLLLLNWTHLSGDTPYRASHAIFVREGAERAYDAVDVVPDVLRSRMLALRAYDERRLMLAAELVDGRALEPAIERLLGDDRSAFLHVHYAARGCFAARIEHA